MNNILIIGPSWIGDMVMAQSLFKIIRARNENSRISVLAPGWCQPIVDRMPEVNETMEMPVGHGSLQLRRRWQIGRDLKAGKFDQAIILPGSLKSALIPWFAGIARRTGFVGEQRWGLINDIRKLDKKSLPKNVQRYACLGGAREEPLAAVIPDPQLTIDPGKQKSARKKFDLPEDRPVIAFCPGAEYGPAKRWPARHFATLARALDSAGWQVWIFGSEKDCDIAGEINQLADDICIDLTGNTSLGEAVDLMATATYCVTNDSGLMHVAAAVGCRVIAIYGSSSPEFTPPLTEYKDIVSLNLECSPCFKRHCPLGHFNCLNQLSAERVLELIV